MTLLHQLLAAMKSDIPEADTPPRKRLQLTTPNPWVLRLERCTASSTAIPPGPLWPIRGQVPGNERERLAYEQKVRRHRQLGYFLKLNCQGIRVPRVTVLETEVHRHEWQRQAADDLAVQHIMRTQALEAGARVDTLEDTGSSS
ncbi:hypothetical protein Tco_0032654 [Tanacetum coccineum]